MSCHFPPIKSILISYFIAQVTIRSAASIRGFCIGFVEAFDKHMNLVLKDVYETWKRPRKKHRKTTSENAYVGERDVDFIRRIRSKIPTPFHQNLEHLENYFLRWLPVFNENFTDNFWNVFTSSEKRRRQNNWFSLYFRTVQYATFFVPSFGKYLLVNSTIIFESSISSRENISLNWGENSSRLLKPFKTNIDIIYATGSIDSILIFFLNLLRWWT